MGSPGTGLAAFPGTAPRHERLSQYAASPADSVSSPWSFALAGPVVAVGDLSSSFFPGPFEDLAHGSPRARAAAGLLGCLSSPWPRMVPQDPGHTPWGRATFLHQHSSVACRGLDGEELVQPGAGEMHVVHADKDQMLWRGGTIPKGLLRNQGSARMLELP